MNSRQKEISFERIFKPMKSIIAPICWDIYNLDYSWCPECPDCEARLLEEIFRDDFKKIRKFGGNKSRNGKEIFENLFEIDGEEIVRGENNSTFATYLTSVLRNAIRNHIRTEKGQYRPSKKASELGVCAKAFEYQIWKGRSIEEAFQHIITIDECKEITEEEIKVIAKKIERKTGKPKPQIDTNIDVTEFLLNKELDNVRASKFDIKTGRIDEELDKEEGKRNKKITENNPLSNIEHEEAEEKYKEIFKSFTKNLDDKDKLMFNAFYNGANISGIAKLRGESRYIAEVKVNNMMEDLLNVCRENNILPPGYKDETSPNFLANQRREDEAAQKRIFEKQKEKAKASNLIKEKRDKSFARKFGEKALAQAKAALSIR